MNEIKIQSGIVIKVNNNNETITVNVEDQLFVEKFFGMIEKVEQVKNYMNTDEVKSLDEREQLQSMIGKTREIMAEIDSIFGDGACRKVFGNIVPNPYLFADFFEQLTPIVKQYLDVRQKKIAEKYSRGRKGAQSNKQGKNEESIKDMR